MCSSMRLVFCMHTGRSISKFLYESNCLDRVAIISTFAHTSVLVVCFYSNLAKSSDFRYRSEKWKSPHKYFPTKLYWIPIIQLKSYCAGCNLLRKPLCYFERVHVHFSPCTINKGKMKYSLTILFSRKGKIS